MKPLPTPSEVLEEARSSVERNGRAALCQVVRTEGSSPGKPGWKLLVRTDGSGLTRLTHNGFEEGTPAWASPTDIQVSDEGIDDARDY